MSRAWPFLYGRGRERGYRLLIVPGLLTDPAALGWLARAASSGRDGERAERMPDGLAVRLAVRSEVVDGELDEFGRPLRISYGVVSETAVSLRDVDAARKLAVGVYREFLDAEESFQPRTAQSLPGVRQVPAARLAAEPPAVARAVPGVTRAVPRPGPPSRLRLVAVAGAVAVALLAFLLVRSLLAGAAEHSLPTAGTVDLDLLTGANTPGSADLTVTQSDGKIYFEPPPGAGLTQGGCRRPEGPGGRARAVPGSRFCVTTPDGTAYELRVRAITPREILAEVDGP
ncbi:hypothetical protein [Nonomuraea soli]|uniref:Uncharacterized protein n=1 Tax=Nonomuraea soli TaxID=1032476 RepID=A0A7W0CNK2_9ACTN|nr:hypothetical protein [Nonomuraea soli]MBA2894215.1 hypothetical protein [Nonomuraea soli]